MGLLIGVGNTKPTFPYDYYYGIEWDSNVANSACTRIGRSELHVSLPIQSRMRRCLLADDGSVVTYLHANDTTKTDTGATANLTGANGQVMVEIPAHYRKFEVEGTVYRCLISEHALPGFTFVPLSYRSAYEAAVDRTVAATPKLCSVVNTTEAFRGGNNTAAWDGTYRTLLGRPATVISLTNFRKYARNRGDAGKNNKGWNCDVYEVQKTCYWLYAIEYANFNSQLAYNAEPDANGYKQGGLGDGVTTLDSTKWNNFNGNYPFVPCGYTNSLGNKTGVVSFAMPFEYDSNGSANYIGEYNAATAYVAGNYVSSGTSLYVCILASTGNAVTNTTYFTPVTRKMVNVPSYRGVENPFGHVWSFTDGCKCRIQSNAGGGLSELYACDDPANYQDPDYTNYAKRGELPRSEGYVKVLMVGEFGENMPATVGGSSTTYFADYSYTNLPASGEAQRGVLFGGNAYNGAAAGFACAITNYTATDSNAYIGSRLCFLPA